MRYELLTLRGARLRLAITLAAAVLVFAVAAGNMLALATRNVALAQRLAGWSGTTVSKQAELLAQNPNSLKMLPTVKTAAIRAMSREPLDFKAARTLASIAVRQNNIPLARKLFSAVGRHTLREPVAHFWLMGDNYTRGRHTAFVREAEIILRQQPSMTPQIFLLFTRLVDSNFAREHLLKRLESNPEWRPGFLDAMGEKSENSAAAYALFRDLARSPAPPKSSELRVWLLHEVGRTDADELVRRWKSLQRPPLAERERLIRNPDFNGSLAPAPFDWTFFVPEGSFSEIGPSPTGTGKALYLEMTGRSDQTVATQLLDLTPGRYRIVASIYPISDLSRRDLTARLSCAVSKRFVPLTGTTIDAPLERWSKWRWDVAIPAGCRVQQLLLGMSPRALTADVRAYFDDFAITPLAR